jgi:hypothetical protein
MSQSAGRIPAQASRYPQRQSAHEPVETVCWAMVLAIVVLVIRIVHVW